MLFDESYAFVQVVESGGFTAAGRALGQPKSTLSRQVARLEEQLGVELLIRSTRKLTLTDSGRAFYERSKEAFRTLTEATELARDDARAPEGIVRVGCSFDFGQMLSKHMNEFRQLYPGVHISLILSQERSDLVGERIDVAFRGGKLDDSSFVCRKLASNQFVFCASPSYLEDAGHPTTVADLKDRPLVGIGRGHSFKLPVEGPDGVEPFDAEPWLVCNEFSILAQALVDGGGIGLILDIQAGPLIAAGKLRRVLPEYSVSAGGAYAVYPYRHQLSPKVRVFVDFVFEKMKEPVAEAQAAAQQC